MVSCVVSPGMGANNAIFVTVNNQTSAPSPTTFRYTPPHSLSITPAGGPTSGRALGAPIPLTIEFAQGPQIVCVLTGVNLGTNGSIQFITDASLGSIKTAEVTRDQVLSWNHTTVVFYMPRGYGQNLAVTPVVAGQTPSDLTTVPPPVLFTYDPPSLLGYLRADRALQQCYPISSCYTTNGTTLCTDVPAQCYDTTGGYLLKVRRGCTS
jgi:hypothetical protein